MRSQSLALNARQWRRRASDAAQAKSSVISVIGCFTYGTNFAPALGHLASCFDARALCSAW
jgi:hypothetical protein